MRRLTGWQNLYEISVGPSYWRDIVVWTNAHSQSKGNAEWQEYYIWRQCPIYPLWPAWNWNMFQYRPAACTVAISKGFLVIDEFKVLGRIMIPFSSHGLIQLGREREWRSFFIRNLQPRWLVWFRFFTRTVSKCWVDIRSESIENERFYPET